jgi:hypothetical protein
MVVGGAAGCCQPLAADSVFEYLERGEELARPRPCVLEVELGPSGLYLGKLRRSPCVAERFP